MNADQAVSLYDVAAGLQAVTNALIDHTDDDRPSAQLCGLALSAQHLARDLARMVWQLVEDSNEFAVEVELDAPIEAKLKASAEAAGRTPEAQAAHLIELGLLFETPKAAG